MVGMTASRVRELFTYDADTGVLAWRANSANGAKLKGRVAGHLNDRGYRKVTVGRKSYAAHRLIWLHVHGVWPVEIDHINRSRSDNRLCNLRDVDRCTNTQNTADPIRKRYALPRGVYTSEVSLRSLARPYQVSIFAKGRRINGGMHATVEGAAEAASKLRKQHHLTGEA